MPASINEELDQRLLKEMYGVGAKRFEAYERLGVRTYEDLLRFYPRAYENRGNTVLLKDAVENEKNSIVLTVGSQPTIAVIRRGMELLKFRAFDESGSCQMT